MHNSQKDERTVEKPSISALPLEQQRQALAKDIALLVVREHRRRKTSLGERNTFDK